MRRVWLGLIASLFIGAGIAHFAVPARYARIVPPFLPAPLLLVYLSGFFEIAGGVGVLVSRTRRAAGIGLIALLIAVFPANIQMLTDAVRAGDPLWWRIALAIRLPLQAALIVFVRRQTSDDRRQSLRGQPLTSDV